MRGKWSQFPVSEPEKHRKTKSSGTSPPVWHNQSWESHEGDLISLRMFLSPSSLISPHGVLQLIKSRPREIFKPHSNTSAIRDDYRKRKIMTLGLLHIEISSWWFCFSSRSSSSGVRRSKQDGFMKRPRVENETEMSSVLSKDLMFFGFWGFSCPMLRVRRDFLLCQRNPRSSSYRLF